MFVFRDALVEAAKTAGMLVDLASKMCFCLWMRRVLRHVGLSSEGGPSDDYHGAIRPDGAFKTSFRDLTAADIAMLKLSATDLTTERYR